MFGCAPTACMIHITIRYMGWVDLDLGMFHHLVWACSVMAHQHWELSKTKSTQPIYLTVHYLDDDLPAAAAASAIMATGVSVAERLCRAGQATATGTLPVRSLSVDDSDRFGERERGFDIS